MADGAHPYNDLEAEGFSQRARAALEIHIGDARMLQAMLAAGGRPAPIEALDRLTLTRYSVRCGGSAAGRVATRVCWLRDALADVGFARAAIYRSGAGYAIRADDARAIRRFVLAGEPPCRDAHVERFAGHALVAGLIARLPPPGAVWPADDRVAWLRGMCAAFDLIYERPAGEAHGHVVVARMGTRP